MRAPPIPLPTASLMGKKAVLIASGGSAPEKAAAQRVQGIEDAKSESRVRSSFGGTHHSGGASAASHALAQLYREPHVLGCTDPALRNFLLNVLQQEKRQSILSYGSYGIRIIRVQEHKLLLLLESAPDLLERPEIRDLFLGRPAGGLRFSAVHKPVRSKLGGGAQHEQ